MALQDTFTRWGYRYVPDQVLGELLSTNWIDNVIPFERRTPADIVRFPDQGSAS